MFTVTVFTSIMHMFMHLLCMLMSCMFIFKY